MLLQALERIELLLAAPQARWALARRDDVAFEFDILRLQLGVQDRLQVLSDSRSRRKRYSALGAVAATTDTGDASDEGAVGRTGDRITQEPFAQTAYHKVLVRHGLCPKGFVLICHGVEDVESRAR